MALAAILKQDCRGRAGRVPFSIAIAGRTQQFRGSRGREAHASYQDNFGENAGRRYLATASLPLSLNWGGIKCPVPDQAIVTAQNAMQARRPTAPLPSRPSPRPRPEGHPQRREIARSRPWGKIGETGAQLGVGSLAIGVAIFALASLIPHYRAQQERLQAIRLEVTRTQSRVDRLRSQLHRNFDPQQAGVVMQEQTARVDPQLWPIVFLTEDAPNGDRVDAARQPIE